MPRDAVAQDAVTAGNAAVPEETAHQALHRVSLAGTDIGFEVAAGERILTAALRAAVWVPFECGWGSCGTCKMTLIDGEVSALFTQAPSISPRDARRARILACQSTPETDVVVKPSWVHTSAREGLATERCAAVLLAREEIGPDIFGLRFDLDHAVVFNEGQHAVIDLGGNLRRCYSMSNRPGTRQVEFIVKRYRGRAGSTAVTTLPTGAEVYIEMPYGEMWLRDSERPVCLVAGGTGIAPILSMLHRLSVERDCRPVRVFYGANVNDELVCWDELAALVGELADAELIGALTQVHPGWHGVQGLVTHALEPMLGALTDADFYVAGPPVMTNAVRNLLSSNDIQLHRIHYDSFG